jgi:hypothetical protein
VTASHRDSGYIAAPLGTSETTTGSTSRGVRSRTRAGIPGRAAPGQDIRPPRDVESLAEVLPHHPNLRRQQRPARPGSKCSSLILTWVVLGARAPSCAPQSRIVHCGSCRFQGVLLRLNAVSSRVTGSELDITDPAAASEHVGDRVARSSSPGSGTSAPSKPRRSVTAPQRSCRGRVLLFHRS